MVQHSGSNVVIRAQLGLMVSDLVWVVLYIGLDPLVFIFTPLFKMAHWVAHHCYYYLSLFSSLEPSFLMFS